MVYLIKVWYSVDFLKNNVLTNKYKTLAGNKNALKKYLNI